MKVIAIQKGFYDNELRKEGDEFVIKGKDEFSEKWMKSLSKPGPKPKEPVLVAPEPAQ
jgi:hypothetical protein